MYSCVLLFHAALTLILRLLIMINGCPWLAWA
jgi:hypothetical protein